MTPQPQSGVAQASNWLQMSWQPRDHHRVTTYLALVGVAIAAAMAVYGLPPVDLHGPLHRFGVMDPLCGGTRSARYTAQGEWALAWKYNPLGILTVLGAVAVTIRTTIGALTHRWLTAQVSWTPRRRRIAILILLALLVALQVRQQLRAELLIAGT